MTIGVYVITKQIILKQREEKYFVYFFKKIKILYKYLVPYKIRSYVFSLNTLFSRIFYYYNIMIYLYTSKNVFIQAIYFFLLLLKMLFLLRRHALHIYLYYSKFEVVEYTFCCYTLYNLFAFHTFLRFRYR